MYINELHIHTKDLLKQKDFYCQTLGLALLSETGSRISLKMGRSVLHMEEADHATPYHFAINIPSNQVTEALGWLKKRVEILKDGDREIQDFTAWNAMAMYFYDPGRNIVELIARRDLDNQSGQKFGPEAFLAISEIGLPVDNIEKIYYLVSKEAGLTKYSGNFRIFCAIGDPHGLLICIRKNKKGWYPSNDTAHSSDFQLFMTSDHKDYTLSFKNGELVIENNFGR